MAFIYGAQTAEDILRMSSESMDSCKWRTDINGTWCCRPLLINSENRRVRSKSIDTDSDCICSVSNCVPMKMALDILSRFIQIQAAEVKEELSVKDILDEADETTVH